MRGTLIARVVAGETEETLALSRGAASDADQVVTALGDALLGGSGCAARRGTERGKVIQFHGAGRRTGAAIAIVDHHGMSGIPGVNGENPRACGRVTEVHVVFD